MNQWRCSIDTEIKVYSCTSRSVFKVIFFIRTRQSVCNYSLVNLNFVQPPFLPSYLTTKKFLSLKNFLLIQLRIPFCSSLASFSAPLPPGQIRFLEYLLKQRKKFKTQKSVQNLTSVCIRSCQFPKRLRNHS